MLRSANSAPPLYPFLVSVYFIVALAAANGGELIGPRDLLGPILIGLLIEAVIFRAIEARTVTLWGMQR